MNVFQYMMRKKVLALCIGIMCILGCGETNIRETYSSEAVRRETDIKDTVVEDVYRNTTSNSEDMKGTIMQETGMSETAIEEADTEASIMREIETGETERSATTDLQETQTERGDSIRNDITETDHYDETGIASFISDEYDGEMTASGVRYDRNKMTAAHHSLPFDTKIVVTNLKNKRSVEVIIIDRFTPTSNRILNLSYAAAVTLDLVESGVAKVGIKVITETDQGLN